MRRFIFSIFFLIFIFNADLALASTLKLSPGTGSVEIGKTLSVKVNLNTGGDSVNAVAAYISYPSDLLDVTYVTAGGRFSIEAENSFGGGQIKISRGSISPVSGNVTIATIGFKGKAIGSATVAFTAGSAAPRASDSTDSLSPGSSSGGTINVVKPSPVSKVVNETLEVVKAPVISEVKVLNINTSSATISWKTDKPSDSTIEYGLEKGAYFLNASDGNLVTEHKIILESPLLTPGASFHFRVLSKDSSNNVSMSEDMSFQLTGSSEAKHTSDLLPQKTKLSQTVIDRIVAGVLITGITGLIIIVVFYFIQRKRKGKNRNTTGYPEFPGTT